MRTMRQAFAALLLLCLLASPIGAHDEPVPVVVAYQPVPSVGSPGLSGSTAQRTTPGDWGLLVPAYPRSRPVVTIPPSPVIVVSRDPGGATTPSRARTVSGAASWFCGYGSACTHGYPGGLYAAAGPALRQSVPHWRGARVLVELHGRRVYVSLIDWCACPGGRLLDLYSDAFLRLAPLDRGLVRVTVTW